MGRIGSGLRGLANRWLDRPLPPGRGIGDCYRVIRCLGMGSYGITYLCREADSGREVVVKQQKPSKRDLGRLLLEQEMAILSELDHPQIPRLYGGFEHRGKYHMVTEYVDGQTVEQMIFEAGVEMGERDVLHTTRQVMEVVEYIHRKGYVHLDIRIPNVILRDGRPHLIDFGLARRIGEHWDPGLFPDPEALRYREAAISSDLYAVGHFMLFMLYTTFQVPQASEEVEAPRTWEEELELSPLTKAMIRRLFQVDEPYDSTAAFIGDIDEALAGEELRRTRH